MKIKLLVLSLITASSFNFLSAQSTSPSPYCDASFDDQQGFPVADAINSVSLGTLTNATNAQYAAPHYVFYNNLAAPNLVKGNTYNLSVVFNVQGGAGFGVWIDFNHNNTFDQNELVMGSTASAWLNISSNTVMSQNITIPLTALTGTTRMRVRIVEDDNYTMTNGAAILPCNLSSSITDVMDWGETEDYTVNITSSVGISEISEMSQFTIYPTLVSNTLTVNKNISEHLIYVIRNVAGQEIQTGNINSTEQQIGVNSLSEGIYFLQLLNNTVSLGQQKFIKTKE